MKKHQETNFLCPGQGYLGRALEPVLGMEKGKVAGPQPMGPG